MSVINKRKRFYRLKYKNCPTSVDGITFASKKEAKRYKELKLLERSKKIDDLILQPKFPIVVNGQKVCAYIGDFTYTDLEAVKTVVEDVKGVKTPVYKLKKKLVKALYDIDIVEVISMKYIRTEFNEVVIFSDSISHKHIAKGIPYRKTISAGFAHVFKNGVTVCGESVSLGGMKPKSEDAELIAKFLSNTKEIS